jgi:Ankyrin repeats (many copies)
MNRPPPSWEPPDDVDAAYRSAAGAGTPSESVRRAILGHAAGLAAQRLPVAAAASPRAPRRWRPAAIGGIAAAALAGLLIAPRFLTPTRLPSPPPLRTTPAPAANSAAAQSASPTQPAAAARPAPPARSARSKAPASPPAPASDALNEIEVDQLASMNRGSHDVAAVPERKQEAAADSPSYASAPSFAAKSRALRDTVGARESLAAPAPRLASGTVDSASALRAAAESGDMPRLQALLAEQIDLEARDSAGRTALLLAVLRGQSNAVDALLAAGADPNSAAADGATPLEAAQSAHRLSIAAALRRAGAR